MLKLNQMLTDSVGQVFFQNHTTGRHHQIKALNMIFMVHECKHSFKFYPIYFDNNTYL